MKFIEIKSTKLLIDYLENYENKVNKKNIEKLICNNYCKNILNDMIHLYNNIDTPCKNESNVYCNELEQCKKVYKIKNLLELNFNGDTESPPMPQKFFHNAGSHPQTTLLAASLTRLGGVNLQNTPASSPDNSANVKINLLFSITLI